MARGKKKEASFSLEERLESALVPTWEQPYQVPENWKWVYLGTLGYTSIGLTYKPSDKSTQGTIVLRSSNIQNGEMDYSDIVRVEMDIPESKMSQKGDILICARNGSKSLVGKVAIIDKEGMSYGAFMAIFRSPYNKLIFHYFNSHYFRDIIDKDVGTTTINQITQETIKKLPFPLPPLTEQQRIVDRIESLFAKLDEAKEKAQEALDSFEMRKKAMLERAFSGKLTTVWRTSKNIAFPWNYDTLINSCEYLRAGGDKPDDFSVSTDSEHTVPVVANGIQNEGIIGYTAIEKEESGAVTVSGRGTIGYSVTRNYPFYPVVRLIVARPKNSITPQFLKYHFDAQPVEGTGTSIPQLTVPMIKNREIPVPSIEEQIEIVRLLDAFFVKEAEAKAQVEATMEAIDLMKKSILAKAFRGELGTNDPTEESAEELIRQVLEIDAPTPKRVKAIQISKELSKELDSELERKLVKLFLRENADTLSIDTLMGIAKDKFAIMESLHNLEQKQIIKRLASGDYRFMR